MASEAQGSPDDALEHDALVSTDHSEVCRFLGLLAQPAHGRESRFSERNIVHHRLALRQHLSPDGEPFVGVPRHLSMAHKRLRNAGDEVHG
jgi:hypothetical protein